MRIALFGGTFDPVHLGHLAIAGAAADKFRLDQIHFVPAQLPPHKTGKAITDFQHRFAMLALATADDPRFIPSLLEAGQDAPNYSIQTVRRLKSQLKKSDKLYFLIGMDAFKDIAIWRQPVELLAECDFIVASRPGHSLAEAGAALPEELRPPEAALKNRESISLPNSTIHLLADVSKKVSSTQIRAAAHKSAKQIARYVPRLVAEYIKKERLYIEKSNTLHSTPREALASAKVLSFRGARIQER
ncbi:MAG TPA: nicotinate-nucleotide adenylyltransferase [Candidatus Angelobacter sp.]|nr:nicotinate-nucleotide adenylyltransferase [Candidatus Angelobacter sp.]